MHYLNKMIFYNRVNHFINFSLGNGLPTSFPALAQSGALSSPFTLPFQQLSDPSKLARQWYVRFAFSRAVPIIDMILSSV